MDDPALEIPRLLEEMIAVGRWPATADISIKQNLRPLASRESVHRLAPDEGDLYLLPPPFHTVREWALSSENEFWNSPKTDPSAIDFDLAIVIGDFGLGSDAPILLDYRVDPKNPRVIRLQWIGDGSQNRWVVMANDFESFVSVLGL